MLRADLVLEGGGVKGIGLVDSVAPPARAGDTFPRRRRHVGGGDRRAQPRFGDLRQDDDESALPSVRRYSLAVTPSDVSRRRLLRLFEGGAR